MPKPLATPDSQGVYPSQKPPGGVVAAYLEATPLEARGLNLGCGGATFEGFINIDAEYPWHVDILWDLEKGLPYLPDGSFSAVYSEHFMEHIPRKTALRLMKQSFAALRSGGRVRIAMPDLDDMIRNYLAGAHYPRHDKEFEGFFDGMFYTSGEWFNVAMRAWGHTYIYNFQDAALLLRAAGFVDVERMALNVSDFPLLANRETRPAEQSALIVEARKP